MVKVAVVVPVYNVKNYIKECLNSLVNQSLKDILIIVVNDGSTDNSLKIIQEYANKDKRIIIIDKQHNTGYGDTMNIGIARAINEGAEYIAFMDPDDYIALDGYEKLYNTAKENEIDVLRANITSIIPQDDGTFAFFKNDALRMVPEFYNKVLKISDYKQLFMMNSNCGGLFKASFIKEYNIKHNTTPGAAYQDIGFWFQSYCWSKRFYFLDDRYYFYRRERAGSSEAGKKDKNIIFKEYEFIREFLIKNNLFYKFRLPYFSAKYRSLYWYFHILRKEDRREFVCKISDDFIENINNNLLTLEEAKAISNYLFMIITNPEEFLREKESEDKLKNHSPLVVPK